MTRTLIAGAVVLFTAAVTLTSQGRPQPQQTPQQQNQAPTFRSSTALVEVDIIVKDKDGKFVAGLTADDFEVLEEGKPQPIQHFYLVTETPTTSLEPRGDVMLPRSPDQTNRRIFVLFFDSDHLSSGLLGRLKNAAMSFVNEQLTPRDLAGVYANGGLWRGHLTTDRQELLDGIRSVSPAFETTGSRVAQLIEYPRIESELDAARIEEGDTRLLDSVADQNCVNERDNCALEGGREYVVVKLQRKAQSFISDARRAASATLDTVTYLSRNLAPLEGRKTIVMISEGFYTPDVRSQLPQIAGQASRAGVTIYTVNARGTQGSGGRIVPDASVALGTFSLHGDTSEEGLDILAGQTGGVAYRHSDDLATELKLVASDTSTYYVLAYSPENTVLDGKFRKIELKTKWAGLTVRARRGYVASPLPPPKQLRKAGAGAPDDKW
jgi:VWFA-related protein